MSAPPRPGPDPAAVHLVGTGPGPVDLLTVRASRLIALSGTCLCDSDVGAALSLCPPTARVVDATDLSPEDAAARIREAVERGDRVVRLYAGDPAQHPGLAAHTRALDAAEIEWELVPGIPAAGRAVHTSPAATPAAPAGSAPAPAAPAAPTTVDSPVTAQAAPP
ncbi:SAM-dependent methyltransferase, partial [Dietzia cinnamea]|uniref:SAM-dependent methyltransferase n=1 Tax=Dietzia cinnamea TaxID=321318 RepID=UPI0021A5B2A7